MDGLLAVWKPEGWTSHDVVAKVRRLLGMKRIGHAGTLDPMVTGVLPLCLGRATRIVEYVQDRPKAYEAVLKLGIATDTEDLTGQVIASQSVTGLQEAGIAEALLRFAGEIEQIPPMYSAVKVDGKRLYELARQGKTVERKPRKVTIHEIRLLHADLTLEQPEIAFSVLCSKGTYIRTLCVDIGKQLGCPAAMARLTRTMSGGIGREWCLTIEQIEELHRQGELQARLVPADRAIAHLAQAAVAGRQAEQALQGQKLPLSSIAGGELRSEGELLRLYDENEVFLGIFEVDQGADLLRPVKVFS